MSVTVKKNVNAQKNLNDHPPLSSYKPIPPKTTTTKSPAVQILYSKRYLKILETYARGQNWWSILL